MAEEKKRQNIERDSLSEGESNEEVSNDSLGTVDPADTTGLESEEPGQERPSGAGHKEAGIG